MSLEPVPYAVLERTLVQLGFQKHVVPTSHIFFDRIDSAALIALPEFSGSATVPLRNLVAARSTVDDFGIANRATFERLLAENAAQHMATTADRETATAA